MGFSIQYIDKDRGVSVRALLLESLSREDMERECRKLVDEGHRDVQLLESRYTVSVVKRFDEIDDDLNKQLKAENAKLRKELEQWHRLSAGIELPEYPVTEFHPKNLERENAKLREFASELMNHWKSGTSRGCLLCERECECQGEDCYYDMKAEELGIEVDA